MQHTFRFQTFGNGSFPDKHTLQLFFEMIEKQQVTTNFEFLNFDFATCHGKLFNFALLSNLNSPYRQSASYNFNLYMKLNRHLITQTNFNPRSCKFCRTTSRCEIGNELIVLRTICIISRMVSQLMCLA